MTNLRNRGFAIVSAIFLLVILAALGVAMLVFSSNQQAASAYDVMGSRAYQAARTGIEWALYRRLNGGCIQTQCQPTWCASTTAPGNVVKQNVAMPSGTTLSPFTVTVTCTATLISNVQRYDPITAQQTPLVIRSIDAYACITPNAQGYCPGAGGLDNIQRHVQVSIQQTY
ncbi:MAG TPA: agglutinin biogenesis protein MshP [Burkholderiaceae bacterium]